MYLSVFDQRVSDAMNVVLSDGDGAPTCAGAQLLDAEEIRAPWQGSACGTHYVNLRLEGLDCTHQLISCSADGTGTLVLHSPSEEALAGLRATLGSNDSSATQVLDIAEKDAREMAALRQRKAQRLDRGTRQELARRKDTLTWTPKAVPRPLRLLPPARLPDTKRCNACASCKRRNGALCESPVPRLPPRPAPGSAPPPTGMTVPRPGTKRCNACGSCKRRNGAPCESPVPRLPATGLPRGPASSGS